MVFIGSKSGDVMGLSLGILITIVIIIILLLVFVTPIRTILIGTLSAIPSLISSVGKSGGGTSSLGTTTTNFTAYNCTGVSCVRFESLPYTWTLNYNGNNQSAFANQSIHFTTAPLNYSLTAYPIQGKTIQYCSNLSVSQPATAKLEAGYSYTIYYKVC